MCPGVQVRELLLCPGGGSVCQLFLQGNVAWQMGGLMHFPGELKKRGLQHGRRILSSDMLVSSTRQSHTSCICKYSVRIRQ